MIIELKVTNLRSIHATQTLSLVASAGPSLPQCVIDKKLPGLAGLRYLKGAAIYGPNASGKSNMVEAIALLRRLVKHSAAGFHPGQPTGAVPFKMDPAAANEPSRLELTFVAHDVRYLLGVSLTPARVTEEYLVAYPKGTPVVWYHRRLDPAHNTYTWEKASPTFKRDPALEARTRENALFLSVGEQFDHPQLTPVARWFARSLGIGFANKKIPPQRTAQLLEDEATRTRIISMLQSADTGICGVRAEEVPAPAAARALRYVFSHATTAGPPVELDFDTEESEGTKRFFALIGVWFDILQNEQTVFIDEIETSLHPLLLRELLALLLSHDYNPHGAQVIFTTHSPYLLDAALLRPDQVWFTEKGATGATQLYPLTDYKPRPGEPLATGYLAGRYGAVPYLPEGIKP